MRPNAKEQIVNGRGSDLLELCVTSFIVTFDGVCLPWIPDEQENLKL